MHINPQRGRQDSTLGLSDVGLRRYATPNRCNNRNGGHALVVRAKLTPETRIILNWGELKLLP